MNEIDWENLFKPEDFYSCRRYENYAEIANQKLWAVIQTQLKVFGKGKKGNYHGVPLEWEQGPVCVGDTHSAYLIKVEEIKP